MKRRWFLVLLPALLSDPLGICAPTKPNFSGTWTQSNDRSVPKRKGDVELHIDHHDPAMVLETTAIRGSGATRHAVQRYTTDGKTSVSTGADGDEFRTSIVWSGQSLVFSVEEHEDSRIILSKETWTLIDNGNALQREREQLGVSTGGDKKQTIIYLKKPAEIDNK